MSIALLHDMMHNEVEVYVDEMIVKSEDRLGHITNLRKFFERIKEYRLRLNSQKCTPYMEQWISERLWTYQGIPSPSIRPSTPKHGKPLLLYLLIIENVVGSMLAQEDDDKNERAVYYLSKSFHDYGTRYIPIEKSCFAFVWAT